MSENGGERGKLEGQPIPGIQIPTHPSPAGVNPALSNSPDERARMDSYTP